MNKFLLTGAALILAAAMSSCHDGDPDYNKVEAPVVESAPCALTGVVTNIQGAPVAGARVELGNLYATTDMEGIYRIPGIANGTYTVKASATGMETVQEQLTISITGTTHNIVWNAALPKINVENVNVTVANGGQGQVISEAIPNNSKAEILIKLTVPANSVPQNTTITISPIYTEESATIVRAASDNAGKRLLIGAEISSSDPNIVITNPVDVTFHVDPTVTENVDAREYRNGSWVSIPYTASTDEVTVSTTKLGFIGLFFDVTKTETKTYQELNFTPNAWDNLYGMYDMYADKSDFIYRIGGTFNARGANALEALLIEKLATMVGRSNQVVRASYPIDVEVPIGTSIKISGRQEINKLKLASRSYVAEGTKYGTVSVDVFTTNRDHNGGGN